MVESLVSILLAVMFAIFLLTVIPTYIVKHNPEDTHLGFSYDKNKNLVRIPTWLLVLYAVFFVSFSALYLLFWLQEMKLPNYSYQSLITDSLLFFGVVNFVTIPLVQKLIRTMKQSKI